jgi:hypothetical protein
MIREQNRKKENKVLHIAVVGGSTVFENELNFLL